MMPLPGCPAPRAVTTYPGRSRVRSGCAEAPPRKHLRVVPLLLAALFLTSAGVRAQSAISTDTLEVGRFGLSGYPYIFYTPETDFALGGALVATFRASADTTRKPSSATLSGYYSIKDQYDIYLVPEYYTPDNMFYITGFIDWGRFVDKFWGIGDTASDFPDVGYVRTLLALQVDVQYRVAEPLTIGMNYDLNNTVVTEKQANPYLIAGSVAGSEGGFSSGLGLSLMFDTRDNGFAPYRGTLLKVNGYSYANWLGSEFSFERLTIDLRHYVPLTPNLVLALQTYLGYANGETPFYQLPLLGGSKVMRGYYLGRYRDNVYLAGQAEARWQMWRKFGAVAWVGLGGVASEFSTLTLPHLRPTVGFGLRYALDEDERLNVRMDVGFGRDHMGVRSNGIYFDVKEAF